MPFRINLDPTTAFMYLDSGYLYFVFIFNLFIFVPLALFTNITFKTALILAVTIESIQLLLHVGIFDVSDIVLYLLGFVFVRLIIRLFNRK